MGQTLRKHSDFSQDWTAYHADADDVRPCRPSPAHPQELDERQGTHQERHLELLVGSQEVVRQLQLLPSPMRSSCWKKQPCLLVRFPPLSLALPSSSAPVALWRHSPDISNAQILMAAMTDMITFHALVAGMMPVDKVDERVCSELVGGVTQRG